MTVRKKISKGYVYKQLRRLFSVLYHSSSKKTIVIANCFAAKLIFKLIKIYSSIDELFFFDWSRSDFPVTIV